MLPFSVGYRKGTHTISIALFNPRQPPTNKPSTSPDASVLSSVSLNLGATLISLNPDKCRSPQGPLYGPSSPQIPIVMLPSTFALDLNISVGVTGLTFQLTALQWWEPKFPLLYPFPTWAHQNTPRRWNSWGGSAILSVPASRAQMEGRAKEGGVIVAFTELEGEATGELVFPGWMSFQIKTPNEVALISWAGSD